MNGTEWLGGARNLAAFAALVAAAASVGCTSLASGTDTADETNPVTDPAWACLSKPIPDLEVATPPPPYVAYALPIYDYLIRPPKALPGITITACGVGDYACAKPIGMLQPVVVSTVQSHGVSYDVPVYPIGIPYNATPFIRVNAPGYLQSEYYLGGPLLGSVDGATVTALGLTLPLVSGLPITPILAADADNLAMGIHATRDPDGAIVALRTLDCLHRPTAGVTLTLDVPGVGFTFLTSQPHFSDGMVNATDPTDETGLAGFANIKVPTGGFINVAVTGKAPNGMSYGQINLTIRPGQVTHADIRPDVNKFGF